MANQFAPLKPSFATWIFMLAVTFVFFSLSKYNVAIAAPRSLGDQELSPNQTAPPAHIYSTIKPKYSFRHSTPSWRKIVKNDDIAVDLIFLIDGSGSVIQHSRNDFNLMKAWVVNVSSGFNISNGNIRIGVVIFSHRQRNKALKDQEYIRTEIPLGSCRDAACFTAGVDAINIIGYTSHVGAAINKTVKFDFATSEKNTHKILVVVTDSPSNDDVIYASSLARSQNISVFAIGVRSYNLTELQIIANGEVHNHLRVYQVSQFSQLDETIVDLQNEIKAEYQIPGCSPLVTPQRGTVECTNGNEVRSACSLSCYDNSGLTVQGNATRTCLLDHESGVAQWNGDPFTCGVCRGTFDLLILLDISTGIDAYQFSIIKDYLIRIVDTFHIGPDAVQVSFLHHDNIVVRMWDYDTFTDRHLLLKEMLNFPHATEKTKAAVPLSYALNRSLSAHIGKRPNFSHVTFIVTDGTSTGYLAGVAQQLHLVSKVVAVGIGHADPTLVSRIASPPSEEFSFTFYHNILGLLTRITMTLEMICHAQTTALRTFCAWGELPSPNTCNISISCSNANKVGSVCHGSCCPGFEIRVNPTSTCNYNGNWSQTTWQCVEKTCAAIPLSQGLNVRCTDECNVNSACVISCDDGYVISGQNNSNCRVSTSTEQVECLTTCQRQRDGSDPGWNERLNITCVEKDECFSNPCRNNGTCHDLVGGFTCTCPPGYSGSMCEENVDDCASSPCLNDATCVDGVDAYSCLCNEGFSGENCATNIDECIPNPCENNGNCTDGTNDYSCECEVGYEGKRCETEIDWCSSVTCANGGSCISTRHRYICRCVEGFEGTNCTVNINECRNNSCVHGICRDEINGFTCQCLSGFSGESCETNINDCGSDSCYNAGNCTDLINGFSCTCAGGFDGARCEVNINDCDQVTCQHGGMCRDGVGAFTCDCLPGYGGRYCDVIEDICLIDPVNKCANGGRCQTTSNGYVCDCAPGFKGRTCQTVIRCPPDLLRLEARPRSSCSGTEEIGTVCTLRCLNGSRPKTFETNKPRNRTCLSSGLWSVDDSEWGCDEILHCPRLVTNAPIGRHVPGDEDAPFIVNSTDDDVTSRMKHLARTRSQNLNEQASANCTDEDMVGSICHLSCREGYRYSGSRMSTCQSNGRWSPPTSGECVRTQCPTLEHLNVTCTNGSHPGSVCNKTCPSGFNLIGSASKICSQSLTWKPSDTWLCLAECRTPPPPIDNAVYHCSASHRNGSTCAAKCLPGFRERDNGQFTCVFNATNSTAEWIGQEGICEPVSCQRSINLADGQVTGFALDDAVRLAVEPYVPTGQQPNLCNYKAVLALQTSRNSSLSINLWYGESPSGHHLLINSNENGSNELVSGLNDELHLHSASMDSSHNLTNSSITHPDVFNPYEHVTMQIERQLLQLRNTLMNDVIRYPLSHHKINRIHFNGGIVASNPSMSSDSFSTASGLCFVCINIDD